jgi:prepilin-type N-terminal cleavage/methylation domain-containing protein
MSRRQQGYTLVELMMAMAVLAVSVTGVMAMQKVTAVSNANARDVAVANRIGQAWLEQLHADARLWNTPTETDPVADITDTKWLGLDWDNQEAFILPAWDAQRQFGPAFDALGRPVAPNAGNVVFCSHLRLRRLTPVTSTRGEIRATVRVFWPRGGTPDKFCEEAEVDSVGLAANSDVYHFIYHTTVVRQNTQ